MLRRGPCRLEDLVGCSLASVDYSDLPRRQDPSCLISVNLPLDRCSILTSEAPEVHLSEPLRSRIVLALEHAV